VCDDGSEPRHLFQNEVDWSAATFRLRRTGCFGACPQYSVSLYPDGRVEYEGAEFVASCGRRIGQVTGEARERLVSAFRTADYLADNLKEESGGVRVSCQETAISAVEVGGRSRVIHHYGPRLYSLRLTRLENLIDEVTNTWRWTSCDRSACSCRPPGQSEREFLEELVDSPIESE